jgi:hypothetical protein
MLRVLIVDDEFIERKYLRSIFDKYPEYFFIIGEAEKRVPRPEGVEFFIWCSISEEYMLRPTLNEIVYVLEVDKSEVVYFDGMKWDYVLNHHYVPKDEKDAEEYLKDLERKGFKNSYSFINEKTAHFYPQERKRVMDSWARVFEIDEWDIFRIQANIWEIRPEMIKDILRADS